MSSQSVRRDREAVGAFLVALGLLVGAPVWAQDPPPPEETAKTEEAEPTETVTEEISVLGSRVEGRSALETAAPLDYIDAEAIENVGALETGQILQRLAPSANFSTTFISDGTDAIRPATLRGTGPDQTLLLFNGKRYHQQSLVHYQQTIGRGSAGFDLNTIPASAIGHMEVLRDGAAAQYGSDAIAGVVNVVLKENVGQTDVMLHYGETYESDGELFAAGVNTGFQIFGDGFLNLTAEYRDRGETNRAGPDSLRVSPPRVTQRIGDPDAEDALLWMNLGVPVGDSGEFYAFGGWSERKTNSSGFFRTAGDGRTVPEYYPNGFLPTITTQPEDLSLVAGFRNQINDRWRYDASLNYGESEFAFREENTVNVSWYYEPINPANPTGPRFNDSPLAADTGTLTYDQVVANLDFAGQVDWGVGVGLLNVAFGLEYRDEGFEIEPGDPVSYTYGRTDNRNIVILDQNGGTAAPGTQGFPGFREAVDESRDNIGVYLDFESLLTDKFLAGVAVRYEDYSDFGSTVDWKVSGRYDFTEKFALRGTASTGFRAPSPQQAFFTLRSTNLNSAGVLTDTLTARPDSAIAAQFGILPLTEETSDSYSLGFVARPSKAFNVTVDFYSIEIDDRIVLSSYLAPESGCSSPPNPATCPIAAILAPEDIGQIQFFTNAADTKTEGVDIVALYNLSFATSKLSLEAALNFTETEVLRINSSSSFLAPGQLFDFTQVTLIEEGQPQERYTLGAVHEWNNLTTNLRFNYFGPVAGEGFTPGFKQTWDGKWLTDLSFSYHFSDALSFTIGGNNIFDEYPDHWDPVNAFPFPQLGFVYGWETTPFGINGGFYFARVNYHLMH